MIAARRRRLQPEPTGGMALASAAHITQLLSADSRRAGQAAADAVRVAAGSFSLTAAATPRDQPRHQQRGQHAGRRLGDDAQVVEAGVIPPPNSDNADFNGDLIVDGSDFLYWQDGFPLTDGTALLADGDANGDGKVTADDLAIWQTQYGTSTPPAAAVPEPAALTSLLVLAAVGGLVRKIGK